MTKANLILKNQKKKFAKFLKRNYYYPTREWPYKNIKPLIICEELLTQENNDELMDYRVFCFNGEPKFITVDFNITDKKKTRRNLYDLGWNLLDYEISYPKETKIKLEKPQNLKLIIDLSKKLSASFPHSRIDFYCIGNKLYFGEITFYHQSGMGVFTPPEFGDLIGDLINLSLYEVKET